MLVPFTRPPARGARRHVALPVDLSARAVESRHFVILSSRRHERLGGFPDRLSVVLPPCVSWRHNLPVDVRTRDSEPHGRFRCLCHEIVECLWMRQLQDAKDPSRAVLEPLCFSRHIGLESTVPDFSTIYSMKKREKKLLSLLDH